jgi:hypothetical protein
MNIKNNQRIRSIKQFKKDIEKPLNEKTLLCIEIISDIDISKYNQLEYRSIVNEIYNEVFKDQEKYLNSQNIGSSTFNFE